MARKRTEFEVVLEGVNLDSRRAKRLAQAIHRAAIAELATSDFRGDYASLALGGGLQGRHIRTLSAQQLRSAGLKED